MGKKRKKKARSRFSDSGEDAKEKGTHPSSPQFPSFLFSCLHLLNSADSTISEPGTGYAQSVVRVYTQSVVSSRHFIPSPCFINSPQSVFYTDRFD